MPAAKLSIRARWEATFFFFHHRSKYSAAINPEVPKTQGVCIHWTGQLDWTTELTFCHIKKIYRYTIRLSTSLANALKPPQGDTCSLVSCQLVYVTVVTPVRLLLWSMLEHDQSGDQFMEYGLLNAWRATSGVCVQCSYVQNAGKEALHQFLKFVMCERYK